MGSVVIMRLLLPCVVLLLTIRYSDSLHCLQCSSAAEEVHQSCVDGSVSESSACDDGMDGCMVMLKVDQEVWDRSCCSTAESECLNEVRNGIYVKSCNDDNCNTYDPRNNATNISVAFSSILVIIVVIICNIHE